MAKKRSRKKTKRRRSTLSTSKIDPAAEFSPEKLDRTVLAIPLIEDLSTRDPDETVPVILDLNLLFPEGRDQARQAALERIAEVVEPSGDALDDRVDHLKSDLCPQYLFANLSKTELYALVQADDGRLRGERARSIYKIWPDFRIEAKLDKSVTTIKADAARTSFAASGKDIVWVVMDSGIDGSHPHFAKHETLTLSQQLEHLDLTGAKTQTLGRTGAKLADPFGHGTHVAGIIAGQMTATAKEPVYAVSRERDSEGDARYVSRTIDEISGVAPLCKLVSVRVLDKNGKGRVSNLMAAIGYVQKTNEYGRWIRIQGVNMSVGYEFDAEWFACGQSPLCVEVDRLVRSGVVVVVAAGNTGYGFAQSMQGVRHAGIDITINDPGNAELAITVGATHRDSPHTYGVSYFSSKGPTGDGRLKPDLVAPGEKIVSCAAGEKRKRIEGDDSVSGPCHYLEDSGTSMAAPHVSGAIAAFLSIRREFIGQPERVKEIFLQNATDLKRERYFQGHGLVDLMRAIQAV